MSGSRQYRSVEERLISKKTFEDMLSEGTLPVAVDPDFDKFLEGRQKLLAERLAQVNRRAKDGLLPGVTIEKGNLKITPIEKSTPPEAEALVARLYAMLPRIRITDLLAEVARWTQFADCFTDLRTGATAADSRTLLAALLAEGLNLGLTRMAEACSIASLGGSLVRLIRASANRDPDLYDDAEVFDPDKERRMHMAFGRGIHTCLGNWLARLEATISLRRRSWFCHGEAREHFFSEEKKQKTFASLSRFFAVAFANNPRGLFTK